MINGPRLHATQKIILEKTITVPGLPQKEFTDFPVFIISDTETDNISMAVVVHYKYVPMYRQFRIALGCIGPWSYRWKIESNGVFLSLDQLIKSAYEPNTSDNIKQQPIKILSAQEYRDCLAAHDLHKDNPENTRVEKELYTKFINNQKATLTFYAVKYNSGHSKLMVKVIRDNLYFMHIKLFMNGNSFYRPGEYIYFYRDASGNISVYADNSRVVFEFLSPNPESVILTSLEYKLLEKAYQDFIRENQESFCSAVANCSD
jgi:uncharacterized protein YdeI (BOF family)